MYLLDTNICIYAINKRPEGVLGKIYEKSKRRYLPVFFDDCRT